MKAENKYLVVISMLYIEPRIRICFRKQRQMLEKSWYGLHVLLLPQRSGIFYHSLSYPASLIPKSQICLCLSIYSLFYQKSSQADSHSIKVSQIPLNIICFQGYLHFTQKKKNRAIASVWEIFGGRLQARPTLKVIVHTAYTSVPLLKAITQRRKKERWDWTDNPDPLKENSSVEGDNPTLRERAVRLNWQPRSTEGD